MGPEAAKPLSRILYQGAAWLDGSFRSRKQEELRQNVGIALMKHVWLLLDAKNLLQ